MVRGGGGVDFIRVLPFGKISSGQRTDLDDECRDTHLDINHALHFLPLSAVSPTSNALPLLFSASSFRSSASCAVHSRCLPLLGRTDLISATVVRTEKERTFFFPSSSPSLLMPSHSLCSETFVHSIRLTHGMVGVVASAASLVSRWCQSSMFRLFWSYVFFFWLPFTLYVKPPKAPLHPLLSLVRSHRHNTQHPTAAFRVLPRKEASTGFLPAQSTNPPADSVYGDQAAGQIPIVRPLFLSFCVDGISGLLSLPCPQHILRAAHALPQQYPSASLLSSLCETRPAPGPGHAKTRLCCFRGTTRDAPVARERLSVECRTGIFSVLSPWGHILSFVLVFLVPSLLPHLLPLSFVSFFSTVPPATAANQWALLFRTLHMCDAFLPFFLFRPVFPSLLGPWRASITTLSFITLSFGVLILPFPPFPSLSFSSSFPYTTFFETVVCSAVGPSTLLARQ